MRADLEFKRLGGYRIGIIDPINLSLHQSRSGPNSNRCSAIRNRSSLSMINPCCLSLRRLVSVSSRYWPVAETISGLVKESPSASRERISACSAVILTPIRLFQSSSTFSGSSRQSRRRLKLFWASSLSKTGGAATSVVSRLAGRRPGRCQQVQQNPSGEEPGQ